MSIQEITFEAAAPDKPISDDVVTATLMEMELVDNQFEPDRKQIRFRWQVNGGEDDGRKLASWANHVPLTPKAKLRGVIEALLGRQLRDGETPPKSTELIGRQARLVVDPVYSASGTLANKVTDVRPLRGGRAPEVVEEIPL